MPTNKNNRRPIAGLAAVGISQIQLVNSKRFETVGELHRRQFHIELFENFHQTRAIIGLYYP